MRCDRLQMASPLIVFVVAVAENGVIGREGRLPWRMPSDMRLFRRLTMGKPVVMGRRTFDSLKKPLEGRDNIVVTRRPESLPMGLYGAADPVGAVEIARELAQRRAVDEIMIIGGAEIYGALLPQTDRIYLTRVHSAPEGDTFMPELPPDWGIVTQTPVDPDPRDEFRATLLVLERVSSAN